MSDTMDDERALHALKEAVEYRTVTVHGQRAYGPTLAAALDHIAARLAQQPAEPMFTASMYGSAEAAEKARIAVQQPAAARVIAYRLPGAANWQDGAPDESVVRSISTIEFAYAQALASNAGVPEVDETDVDSILAPNAEGGGLAVTLSRAGIDYYARCGLVRSIAVAYRARLIERMKGGGE